MRKNRVDTVWETIRREVADEIEQEPMLASFFDAAVLNHKTLDDALSFHLASKLESSTLTALTLRDLFGEALASAPEIGACVRADIGAICTRDPACRGKYSVPLLYFKGFHAVQAYRMAHYSWQQSRQSLALFLQSRIAEVFSVDIHPAARIGSGILLDHATGFVVGETAVIEDDVSVLHQVTLGGTGKERGDRHPKIRRGVLIGAGATVLGNIEIGEGAVIGAGSVVLDPVPPHRTAVGVPARVVGAPKSDLPALEMDHRQARSSGHEES